jgi:hypothetical protein
MGENKIFVWIPAHNRVAMLNARAQGINTLSRSVDPSNNATGIAVICT